MTPVYIPAAADDMLLVPMPPLFGSGQHFIASYPIIAYRISMSDELEEVVEPIIASQNYGRSILNEVMLCGIDEGYYNSIKRNGVITCNVDSFPTLDAWRKHLPKIG